MVASDKFAGTLSASEACEAIGSGWLESRPHDTVEIVPMADGGPGTVDVVAHAGIGELQTSTSVDQMDNPIEVAWLAIEGSTALIEASSVCGLHLVPVERRRPTEATTRGLGLLLAEIASRGFERALVGLGGSGTVDGGFGLAQALGAHAFDADGHALTIGGPLDYGDIASVTGVTVAVPEVVALADVVNPLLGSRGAARVFGPQKGATASELEELEQWLLRLADAVESSLLGGPWRDLKGAGAAGGLGFGLMAWTGATLTMGAESVGRLVGLEDRLLDADVAITGEGSLDAQTGYGKVPAHVADVCERSGVPVLAAAGRATPGASARFDVVERLGEEGLADPYGAARRAGAQLAEKWK